MPKEKIKRLKSGIKLDDGLSITIEFLEWYRDYIKENMSYAYQTIKQIDDVLDELLDGTIDELTKND